jgi:hypothetical protein
MTKLAPSPTAIWKKPAAKTRPSTAMPSADFLETTVGIGAHLLWRPLEGQRFPSRLSPAEEAASLLVGALRRRC